MDDIETPKLSTGQPSTLGSYLDNCNALGLKAGAKFFEDKIAQSPKGREERVIAAESQVMYSIANLERRAQHAS
jgi:hypothetical protein